MLSKKHEKLLEKFLGERSVKDSSKAVYKNSFIRLIKLCFGESKKKYILSQKESAVLDIINASDLKLNSKIDILKIYRSLLDITDKPHIKTDDVLNGLFKDKDEFQSVKNTEQLEKSDLTFQMINDILNESTGLNYILLYILVNYNVRNKDLIIKHTTKDAVDEHVKTHDIEGNVIYKLNGSYIYIRNDYKTKSRYGMLKNVIKDSKFIEAMDKTPPDEMLFKNKSGTPYSNLNINKLIGSVFSVSDSRLTNVNQQLIYKIIVDHYELMNDNNALKKIAQNRPHTRATQELQYSTRPNTFDDSI